MRIRSNKNKNKNENEGGSVVSVVKDPFVEEAL